MAKRRIRRAWGRFLKRLKLRRRAEPQTPVAAVAPLPSWTPFLPFIPEESEDARANSARVLELLFLQGQLPGSSEQQWLVDQILRRLTGDGYEDFVEAWSVDEDFGLSFTWSQGKEPRGIPEDRSI